MTALVLTYHAVEAGPPPLFVEPPLFREHLDCITASGARVLTVSELADALRGGSLPARAVALTFDDGFASVWDNAAPLLLERGLRATVFCVAGRLGADNGWPSQAVRAPMRALADAAALTDLARAGFEIGSHGWDHAPLHAADAPLAEREVHASRQELELAVGAPVTSFAYPYGALPSPAALEAVTQTYSAACTAALGVVRSVSDPFRLPRVDAHYVRRPELLRRILRGELGGYLWARNVGARARRTLRKDYVEVAA
jgi:peptidoglycan/xylan/chitin deacetylase (PgdA/CDA1 family)